MVFLLSEYHNRKGKKEEEEENESKQKKGRGKFEIPKWSKKSA